ncbi:ABC transporter ATP-binding protein [Saxibacter everestensis]|uniref:ABC transporter ATP-binding protein n=1 Tax=Saxibacter everestensis TaxID=2909229 RepID=A0ABY8QS94_9MICO|nr:ABC transporter ATP-binding protein [Brevibacteriaceae bacterium ZFBP1038]
MTHPAVELAGISKAFGPVIANQNVDLTLRRGSIHALMGENGAGKSTLMSILYGIHRPDSGQILRNGSAVSFDNPQQAMAVGLSMVHQHFRLFDSLTVAENVVFGAEPRRFGQLDSAAAERRVRELADQYGLAVEPAARVGSLPVGVRQRVEILKALHRNSDVLILDEPTASLTPGEVTSLFEVIRRAANQGSSIVLVTHKIPEVLDVSDEVTVLRDGRVSGRFRTADTSAAELVEAMTGRVASPALNPGGGDRGERVLEVADLTVNIGGRRKVDAASFAVHAGEIVGIAGVSGNGQHELVQAILGTLPRRSVTGSIRLSGNSVATESVRRRRGLGLAVIPEDRRGEGSAVELSVAENLALGHHRQPPIAGKGFFGKGWMSRRNLARRAGQLIADFGVKTPSEQTTVGALSGGNAQKVVVARELGHQARLLIAEQPTQGVDVGAIESIHRRLIDYRNSTGGILLVSHEISELLALADRILVMFEGKIVAEFPRAEATFHSIGGAMAGAVDA